MVDEIAISLVEGVDEKPDYRSYAGSRFRVMPKNPPEAKRGFCALSLLVDSCLRSPAHKLSWEPWRGPSWPLFPRSYHPPPASLGVAQSVRSHSDRRPLGACFAS